MPLPDKETLQLRLGEALGRLRESSGLTHEELAQAMGEDPSFGAEISRWERGESSPSGEEIWRCLDAQERTFSDLDLELHPEARNPRLREISRRLRALAED